MASDLPRLPNLGKLPPLNQLNRGPTEKTDKEKVKALKEQIAKKEKELGKKHKNSPSILNRVFDVLSRGNYASAEAARSGKESENKGKGVLNQLSSYASGFGKGLTGKKKTTFSEYFKEAAKADTPYGNLAKNKVVQVGGGLGLDIFADPTLPLGLGTTGKGKNVAELAKIGGEATKVATKLPEAKKAGQAAVNLAQKAGTLNAIGKTPKKFAKEIQAVHKSGVQNYAVKAGEAAKTSAKAADKPAVALKFAGVPIVKSEKAYKLLDKHLVEKISKSAIGNTFSKAFRPEHTFKHGTNVIQRRGKAVAAHFFQEEALKVGSEFSKLTPAEKISMQNALRAGAPVAGISKKGEDLAAKAKRVLEIDEDIFNRRKALGLESKKAKYDPTKAINSYERSEGVDHFLADRLSTLHNQAGRKAVTDEITKLFGVKTSKELAEKQGLISSKGKFAPKDTYFHPDIAKGLEYTKKVFDDEDVSRNLLKVYDSALGALKTSQTVVNPGHQAQNLMGDVYKSAIDGLTNPLVYKDAGKAVQGIGKIGVKGKYFTGEEWLRAFNESGGDVGLITSDILKKSRVPVLQGIKKFSQKRENFARIAHFIHAVREHPGSINNFDELLEAGKEAIKRVNHFHFDYGDKTDFEKQFMSRVIPFYTWVRKNIPNELESLVQRPGRVATVPKIGRNVEQALGTSDDAEGIVPKYIRESFPIKIGGNKYITPNLPITDLGKAFEGDQPEFLRHQLSNTSPLIKLLVERSFEKSLFTGAPNEDSNFTYLGSQVPLARLLLKKINSQELTDDQKINYLTSAGIRTVTDKSKASELRRIKSLLDAAVRKQKEKNKKKPLPVGKLPPLEGLE